MTVASFQTKPQNCPHNGYSSKGELSELHWPSEPTKRGGGGGFQKKHITGSASYGSITTPSPKPDLRSKVEQGQTTKTAKLATRKPEAEGKAGVSYWLLHHSTQQDLSQPMATKHSPQWRGRHVQPLAQHSLGGFRMEGIPSLHFSGLLQGSPKTFCCLCCLR